MQYASSCIPDIAKVKQSEQNPLSLSLSPCLLVSCKLFSMSICICLKYIKRDKLQERRRGKMLSSFGPLLLLRLLQHNCWLLCYCVILCVMLPLPLIWILVAVFWDKGNWVDSKSKEFDKNE